MESAELLKLASDQLIAKDKEIARMKPKEIFADSVTAAKTRILIGDLAKLMRQNGYAKLYWSNK